jgi:G3E family GTPase
MLDDGEYCRPRTHCAMSNHPVPFTVVGGYLGAGKTTLVNRLLRADDGARLAVIVNDFGDIGIDAELIAGREGDTISLTNGCICCNASDGLVRVLDDLRKVADSLDHVIVEASGVSDPVQIGHYALPFGFELRGVIVLADAEQVRSRAADKYVGDTVIGQLRGADLLMLTKTDLVERTELTEVRAWLGEIAPGTPILESAHGQVSTEVVLGGMSPTPAAPSTAAHPVDYDRWSHVRHGTIDRSALEAFISALPDGVLRAKGIVHLSDDPDHRYVLQLVGHRVTLTRDTYWTDGEERCTRLVVIATPGTLDDELLAARMSS